MQYRAMPSIRTGRRPKWSESGPITNWPTPKPIRNVDSTAWGRLAIVMWNVDAMSGSAGSIMSIAIGFNAMIEAIITTNSGKPIGRWLDEIDVSALISVMRFTSKNARSIRYAASHNPLLGMAGVPPADRDRENPDCGRPRLLRPASVPPVIRGRVFQP